MFVPTAPVPIGADGELHPDAITPETDVIFIRPRMDVGTNNRVISAATQIALRLNGGAPSAGRIDVGAYQTALLVHNILDWQGPSFTGTPCTPSAIERLDPKEPLVMRVLTELNARNQSRVTSDPKSGTSSTAPAPPADQAQ